MRVQDELRGDIVIITLKGDMMGEPDTGTFREKISELLEKGMKKIILDLSGVKWMNSLGLGALISTFTSVKNHGGEMVIANVTKKVESLFMITQLIKVFKHYDSVDDAITALE
jgi:anti-sigma B factor antagonist